MLMIDLMLPLLVSETKGRHKRATQKKPKEIKVEELYPEIFKGLTPPATIYRSRRIGDMTVKDKWGNESKGVLHLAGIGSTTPEVMFVSPCTLFEEEFVGRSGLKPEMLRGPAASVFKRNLAREGFKDADWFYTALCKYNVVKLKPNARDIRWGHESFQDELKTMKPKIVVCLGKLVFDHLYGVKFKLSDISGGFFKIPGTDTLLYPMDTIILPLLKPEYMERFVTDLRQVKRCLDETRGMPVVKVVTSHHVLTNSEQVQNWVTERKQEVEAGTLTNLAVDCEWNGKTFAGGQLRSAQFSWKLGHAAYVRLMGEELDYAMDQPLPVMSQILDPLLNHPKVRFIGHNFFADALWLRNHLGVRTYRRCSFDTLFAQHTINEYADLKLERLAVRYTDLGRYDQKLLLWKRKTKFDEDQENEGYGKVPDSILIPYGLNDVDATLRLFPILTKKLLQQGQLGYYRNRLLPFVSDGFVEMSETGFPMNRQNMDEMRTVFTRNQGVLTQDFREAVDAEAETLIAAELTKVSGNADLVFELRELRDQHYLTGGEPNEETTEFKEAADLFKAAFPLEELRARLPFFLHWWATPGFNINSTDHLRRWLFQVRGFTPLKTTKKDGVQMAWEKVLSLPPEKQAEYTPATDKQTIKLFADKDKLVARIQEVKGVGNVVKAFLKGKDDDGKEQGLMAWIQPDERIHPNYALTETARPRSWSPNVLNWTKNITKPIEAAFIRVNKRLALEKFEEIRYQLATAEMKAAVKAVATSPVSIRSFVQAPPGWCLIDMDFKTAEVVQLGYTAGDKNLVGVLNAPDTQYGRTDPKNVKKAVRIAYNELSCYPESAWDEKLITSPDDPRILRREDGSIMHPKRDLHWELAESVMEGPREVLDERMARDGIGKVGNFSIPYGALGPLLERMIEVNTGRKPKEGIGEKMRETYATRYPTAWRFSERMEEIVEDPGWFKSTSGRIRHFFFNELVDVGGLSEYQRNGILSPLKRQARNFPIQEGVAATAQRALELFLERRQQQGLDCRMMCLLYDAMTILAPLEQARASAKLLRECMTTLNQWTNHGVTWNHEVDEAFGFRWGVKPRNDEKEVLAKYV